MVSKFYCNVVQWTIVARLAWSPQLSIQNSPPKHLQTETNFIMMIAAYNRGRPRTLLFLLVAVVGIMIMNHGQLAGAHQFAIQNRLNDSLFVECQSEYRSNGEQEVWSGKRYVFGWLQQPTRPEDWVCGFSWLGTTFVKQFSVWNYTQSTGRICDVCEWKVDPNGFYLKTDVDKNQTGFHFVSDWDASCLASSL